MFLSNLTLWTIFRSIFISHHCMTSDFELDISEESLIWNYDGPAMEQLNTAATRVKQMAALLFRNGRSFDEKTGETPWPEEGKSDLRWAWLFCNELSFTKRKVITLQNLRTQFISESKLDFQRRKARIITENKSTLFLHKKSNFDKMTVVIMIYLDETMYFHAIRKLEYKSLPKNRRLHDRMPS